jgi:hypothetical protein
MVVAMFLPLVALGEAWQLEVHEVGGEQGSTLAALVWLQTERCSVDGKPMEDQGPPTEGP